MEGDQETPKPSVVNIISPQSWDSYIEQSKSNGTPIVAHFCASWCIPSLAMNHFFEEFASDFQDITFLTVDVDDLKDIASKYEVKAMPTFLLIKEGVVVGRLVGANPEEIKKRIETHLQSNTHFACGPFCDSCLIKLYVKDWCVFTQYDLFYTPLIVYTGVVPCALSVSFNGVWLKKMVHKSLPLEHGERSCQTFRAIEKKWCHVSKMVFGTRIAMAPEFSGIG
ncbi:thioredoxin-like protein CXXS1 [Tanacetum coccineum]